MAAHLKKDEYLASHMPHNAETVVVLSPRQLVRWSTPIRGCVKINLDVAVKKSQQKMGIRLIIREHQGDIMTCLCFSQPLLSHPIVTEYIGLRRAVTFCLELDFVLSNLKVIPKFLLMPSTVKLKVKLGSAT